MELEPYRRSFTVESLPIEIMDHILSYLSYDEISVYRRVSRHFNGCCQRLLNQGFFRAERFHAQCLKAVKKQLPRRESERRTHPLARHCEILTSIETRLSLLSMTFMKYMDMNLCCFIPGKVIDEIFRVLRLVQGAGHGCTTTPPRAHEILQELRDISSMAMEHFDERIAPGLKLHVGPMKPTLGFIGAGHHGPCAITATVPRSSELELLKHLSNSSILPGFCWSSHFPRCLLRLPLNQATATSILGRVQKPCVHAAAHLSLTEEIKQVRAANLSLRKSLTECKSKLTAQSKKQCEQEKRAHDQAQLIAEQGSRLAEQEGKLNELNRKLLEQHREFADVLEEVSRLREQVASSSSNGVSGIGEPDQSDGAEMLQKTMRPRCGRKGSNAPRETTVSSSKRRNADGALPDIEPSRKRQCKDKVATEVERPRRTGMATRSRPVKC
ncbi:F-box only protein 28 isoform X1 [Rhipicephalus sanguineus]|uniref:F-box only protein 28 isoform X1 n=1 Tax=Rhipicephalus sanguineus TaxID=34632 RepID=UPI00189580D5|nr:F-box only protein 28 isoform X1 [Rhipicephalus sanguineus]